MTERERLIELIIQSVNGCARNWAETIADYLLQNGVVVLPCKLDDTVFVIPTKENNRTEVTVERTETAQNAPKNDFNIEVDKIATKDDITVLRGEYDDLRARYDELSSQTNEKSKVTTKRSKNEVE